jgi:hypothetical protein
MQCACAILSSVTCHALQYFSTSHSWHDFIEHKIRVSSFSTTIVRNMFHSKKKWARYDQKYIMVFTQSTLYSCPILIKLEFSWQILEKSSSNKFNENTSIGSRVVPCGWTDRLTDITRLIVAFRNFANAPKEYSQDMRWPGRESNQPILEYDSGVLLLHQSAQYLLALIPDNINLINRII